MAQSYQPGYTGVGGSTTYGTAGGGVTSINPNQPPNPAQPPAQQPNGGALGQAWMNQLGGAQLGDFFGGNMPGGSWNGHGGGGYMGPSTAPQASISPDILNSMQQYSNAAYNQATSRLDPQWQQQQAQFQQQMVSQGLTPGSQAYDAALADFTRGRNDAYSQARDQSMQQGLQAQGQAFQEGLGNANLQNQLDIARVGAGAQMNAAGTYADASMYGADQNAMTQRLLGLGNLGIQYGNLQNNTNMTDYNMLSGLTGQMSGQDMYNNSLNGQQIGNFNAMYNDVPHGGPMPIDVTGPYQMNQNGQLAGYNANVQNQNSQDAMYGALGSAAIMAMMMMCSRVLKDDQGEQDAQETLDAVKTLPLRKWRYKDEQREHIGTYAEDFHAALKLPKSQQISVVDMFGALLGSVQAINTRLEKLESRIHAN